MKKTLLALTCASIVFSACSNPFKSSLLNNNNATVSATLAPSATPIATARVTSIPIPVDQVQLLKPAPNSTVSSPFEIAGKAPGSWFFEGQILGEIKNAKNESLAIFPLQADGEWMTENLVSFTGSVSFQTIKAGDTITLIIRNDNPSGLPENDKSQSFTLKVSQ